MKLSQQKLIILSSVFFTLFYNFTFFEKTFQTYGLSAKNLVYIGSVAVVLSAFLTIFFTLLSSRFTTKAVLITTFLISSATAYFMDKFSIVIDTEMLRNIFQTNLNESLDLMSVKFALYLVILGFLPSFFIYKTKLKENPLKAEIFSKLKSILICLALILAVIFSFSKFYTSFFREHKPLRYYTNPTYWIYSIGNFVAKSVHKAPNSITKIAQDAQINKLPSEQKELVIMVVGEAARADRFSLNGYSKNTNPLLEKEDVISLSNTFSCGTSTAHSVPCMFSIFTRDKFSHEKAAYTQNVLDILNSTQKVNILWRDNNSDSKGVALRLPYEDYKSGDKNSICTPECRDEGMIIGLDEFVKQSGDKSVLIVLHQMGNHGPAYYKRYPKEYEIFTPNCQSNELEKCTREEISNAYDNAILYTDAFLAKVINFLKQYQKEYKTAMIYMSDHGESLGEGGIYLHGMPYFFAPKEQKHIGSIMWFGDGEIRKKYDIEKLKSYKDREFSHDNLFHTLLGIFEVQTEIYDKKLDILNDAKINN
ncbi:MAG: phosphoethanolamine transferase [Campylobacter sp.]